MDCVEHDSVAKLKRLTEWLQIPFLPYRSASLACYAAAIKREFVEHNSKAVSHFPLCQRHR